jgi:hypothetical protein
MVTVMNLHLKGAAKCLIFSLLAAASLGGCAYYEAYPSGYGYDAYPYGQPGYAGAPYYVGPPISLDLRFESRRGGGHHGHRGHHGGHHHGGRPGGWGGWHR